MSATYSTLEKKKESAKEKTKQWFLRGLSSSVAGRIFPLDTRLTIGRGLSCEIVLDDSAVSREHLQLSPTSLGVSLVDFHSLNGTWVNGERVTAALLESGDKFNVGPIYFELSSQASEKNSKKENLLSDLDSPKPRKRQKKVLQLVIESGGMQGLKVPLQGDKFTVGRSPDNDIVFKEPSISRLHATLFYSGSELIIEDHQSTTGTAVNNKQITSSPLKQGDKIRLGDMLVHVEEADFHSATTIKTWFSRSR